MNEGDKTLQRALCVLQELRESNLGGCPEVWTLHLHERKGKGVSKDWTLAQMLNT